MILKNKSFPNVVFVQGSVLEKSKKNKDINLETDLLLSKKDFAAMRKKPFKKEQNLEDYFDFLEDIGAFESNKVKTKFYDAEFKL